MHDQLKLEPLELSPFYPDGRASRHPVDGTVARGQLRADLHLEEGRRPAPSSPEGATEGELVDTFPFEVTQRHLLRGRQRYDIYCAPCHSKTGDGDGMVVRRGYRKPPSLHDQRLRDARVGHLYDVIRRGFGVMPAYAAVIDVEDRWAVVAYLRALQLSRNARIEDVPAAERQKLEAQEAEASDVPATEKKAEEPSP
jgi:hypothetical protein